MPVLVRCVATGLAIVAVIAVFGLLPVLALRGVAR